ncbi:DUF4442 domain-containing protein [Polaribacter aquimarinus]|uniref:Thioesterase n=1 Tax=Polaribacter aquimarinus TaxID=2100726 RepID=A0A2U2JAE5_9FLAO|nr:DUF4442 domain-containing protein [Polaribacter aquimarinus]PWG05306.1 thioesterase [Polaribacter aquimarinus]
MKITPAKINSFMFFKLPLGWLSGLRVKSITESNSIVIIRHRWINQNPFKSMFWAAQGMAAEMTTGVLVMNAVEASNKKFSMLVTKQEGGFFKKATGKITFTCNDGYLISSTLKKSIATKEGQLITLSSEGKNEDGVVVSNFKFEWSIKVKL